jgi:hypothetical protein
LGEITLAEESFRRNSHLKTLENEILLVLIFHRFYVTHEFLWYLFNLDNPNICRHLKKIEPLLSKNLAIKKDRKFTAGDLEKIIVDATEIIQNPVANHPKEASHTL